MCLSLCVEYNAHDGQRLWEPLGSQLHVLRTGYWVICNSRECSVIFFSPIVNSSEWEDGRMVGGSEMPELREGHKSSRPSFLGGCSCSEGSRKGIKGLGSPKGPASPACIQLPHNSRS